MSNAMDEEILLTPMKFSQRIGKYALVPFHFMIFFEHADLRERIQNHRMKGLDELNEQYTPKMYPNKTPIEIEALKMQHRERLEATTRREVDESLTDSLPPGVGHDGDCVRRFPLRSKP